MSTTRYLAVLALLGVGSLTQWARADGCFFPDARTLSIRRERATISEPEQKAAVVYRAGVEDLIISPRFSGPAERFAWVIPVPARPKVRSLDGALFHELARLTYTPPSRGEGMRAGAMSKAVPDQVTVVERKDVGAYDVAVLQAGDAGALLRWLQANGFAMLPAAQAPIQEYARARWTFVAARVRVREAAKGLREGTLAPIRLTFKTPRPIYPMRVSRANPSAFTAEIYLILPIMNVRPYLVDRGNVLTEGPGITTVEPIPSSAQYVPGRAKAPTLASLVDRRSGIVVLRRRYTPKECTRDVRWKVPSWAIAERSSVRE